MTLTFRNVDLDEAAPLSTWPYEALVTLIGRGTLLDWVRITRAVDDDPWGPVARQVEEYLSYEQPYGVAPLLTRAIARARAQAEALERETVAREISELVDRSGLGMADLASRLGTSRPRLSTYRSGSVTPSAAFLVRLRRVVDQLVTSAATSPVDDRRG